MRIYLAGNIDSHLEEDWRYSLLAPNTLVQPEEVPEEQLLLDGKGISKEELIDTRVKTSAASWRNWETKSKAVMGHDYVGPFPWSGAGDRIQQRKSAIKRADMVFAWTDGTPVDDMTKMELIFAEGCGKQVYLSRSFQSPNPDAARLFLLTAIGKGEMRGSVTSCLANAIAKTQEVLANGGWRKFASKYPGLCKACGGTYIVGEQIMYSKADGVMHVDCYKAVYDDPKLSANIIFNKDLIQALRKRVAELEKALFEEEA